MTLPGHTFSPYGSHQMDIHLFETECWRNSCESWLHEVKLNGRVDSIIEEISDQARRTFQCDCLASALLGRHHDISRPKNLG